MRACAGNGRDGDMRLMLWPVMHALHYIGFDVMEPELIHGIRGGLTANQADLQQTRLIQCASEYRARRANWNEWPLLPCNHDEDFLDGETLKPDAPVYSPFVRHLA